MKNIRFGVEIELGGYSREQASEIIANYFGTHNEYKGTYYRTWVAFDRKGRAWEVMSDGSVNAGRESCEVVTPLLSYEDIEDLQEVVRQLRRNGYKANRSCGIHIHVDNAGMTAGQIRNLVNLVSAREELIYRALQIREQGRQHWCEKTNETFKTLMNAKKPETLTSIKTLWYKTLSGTEDGSSNHYDHSRYHLLNLHSMWQGKGIEFRCFNGTTHAGEIKAYIQFCLALVAKAKSAKWIKIEESNRRDEHDAMHYFLYSLGLSGNEFKTCRHHLKKHLTHGQLAVA